MGDTITRRDIQHEFDNDGYQSGYKEIAVVANVKITQVAGKTWSEMPTFTIVSSSPIDDENGKPGAVLHLTQDGNYIIEELTTGRFFLMKLPNLIGVICAAIQFMDKHTNNAHIARLYAERYHPDQVDMIDAMKMVEQGQLYQAIRKYDENSVTAALAFGRSLIDGIGVPDEAEETPEE